MSVFSYPRINVKGLLSIDVGTANNDDYSNDQFPPDWGPYAGEPMRLFDSADVSALTYGMTDDVYVPWLQEPDTFVQPTQKGAQTKAESLGATNNKEILRLPGEWNYYGSMGLSMMGVNVIGVAVPGQLITEPSGSPFIGAQLSFKNRVGDTGRSTGMIVDVNAEDVPCSQIFTDFLTLEKDGQALFTAKPTKSVTRWINFQCNTNLPGPNGAGGYFYCVIPADELQGQPILQMMARAYPSLVPPQGILFRSYIYRPLQKINTLKYAGDAWFAPMVELYKNKEINPDFAEYIGTISPWYAREMQSVQVGRVLNPTGNTFPIPQGSLGNTGNPPTYKFGLAPAVASVNDRTLSVDFCGTFPDQYTSKEYDPLQTGDNPKYDFGEVSVMLTYLTTTYPIGNIPYQNRTGEADQRGWVFDLPLPANLNQDAINNGVISLLSRRYSALLLQESEYFIASDQSCIYAEQQVAPPDSTTASFVNQSGTAPGPATIRLYRKGVELGPNPALPIKVWEYDTTPNQDPGSRTLVRADYQPGEPLRAKTHKPGNWLFTLTLPGQPDPPQQYQQLSLMTVPMINLRVLPNNKDYGEYYKDPTAPQPVGNDKLTFEVIYREVLQTYYLLYPAMNRVVPLNDPDYWADPVMAGLLMQRTQKSWWNKAEYMPRTRDLSDSRRTLLHAWCLKIMNPDTP
jgi:hypothetical protein